jgi:exopolyphosphatase / guanosine-5'-triphosphate,3'-diphosphate pyrophosphatase
MNSHTARAAIDIGTQSTNVLVRDANGRNVYRKNSATRLGEDLHRTGVLSQEAMQRTTEVIAEHISVAQQHGATDILITGTAACRRARNTSEFQSMVHERTGVSLQVLSEKEEADLAFTGAISGLPHIDGSTLVIDIGGGSTEYIVGFSSAEMSASIPFGAVTGTASHITTDPARPEDLTNLIGAVADELEEIGRDIPSLLTPSRVVGVAGTIVTIASVEIGLAEFDADILNGFVLTKDAAEDVFRTLATETERERILNPGLSPERADIIVAGCCILVASMRRLHIEEIVVSTHNLLDGLIERGRISS